MATYFNKICANRPMASMTAAAVRLTAAETHRNNIQRRQESLEQ